VSASFHGRDLFAPVAAHLALGAALADAGRALDPAELVALDVPRAGVDGGVLHAHVLHADRFGNVMLDAERADLDACGLRHGDAVIVNGVRAAFTTTFDDVPAGGLLLYEDSYGVPSLAVNRGSALEALGLEIYARVQITPAA
jgi:S-adenosylmethionine hydrolase